jgi:trimethylamine:corrinoid methyltransferase-like protein
MSSERHVIEPITTSRQLRFLEDAQLDTMREATLDILENVDVRFDSEKALAIFSEHGAPVDHSSQIVN